MGTAVYLLWFSFILVLNFVYVAKCNLGKVYHEAMLASSLSSYTAGGLMLLAGAPHDSYAQLLACSSPQSVAAIACCLHAILCFGFYHPSLPHEVRARLVLVSKYSTELFSVTVPGGGRSQGCHGHLPLKLEHYPAPTTL